MHFNYHLHKIWSLKFDSRKKGDFVVTKESFLFCSFLKKRRVVLQIECCYAERAIRKEACETVTTLSGLSSHFLREFSFVNMSCLCLFCWSALIDTVALAPALSPLLLC